MPTSKIRKWKILITAPYLAPVVENYRGLFDAHAIETIIPAINERMSEEELLPLVSDIDGIICGDDRITERVLKNAPKLKIIAKWGTGIDSIDVDAAAKRGIPVRRTADAFTNEVADTVMAFMLCFARQTPWLDAAIRSGTWEKKPGFALGELVIGIVGLGNIGTAVAQRTRGFNMKTVACDIKTLSPGKIKALGVEMMPLKDLLTTADIVSVNCDLNPTSYHLINSETLGLMKPTAYLINTARGPIVNEPDLVKALEAKKIAGAGLDVFEQEPLPPGSPLRKFSNVLLSPHNANASRLAWERVHEKTIHYIIEALSA